MSQHIFSGMNCSAGDNVFGHSSGHGIVTLIEHADDTWKRLLPAHSLPIDAVVEDKFPPSYANTLTHPKCF